MKENIYEFHIVGENFFFTNQTIVKKRKENQWHTVLKYIQQIMIHSPRSATSSL